jgi:RNA polymerase primary sigma factor
LVGKEGKVATSSANPVVVVSEEPMNEEQLLALGRERGYVTLEEIMVVFPEAENDVDRLDEVFTMLMENGIEVGERPEEEPAEAEEEEAADELDEGTLAAIETDDTVGLYLKVIGRIPYHGAGRSDLAEDQAQVCRQALINHVEGKQRVKLKPSSLTDRPRRHLITPTLRLASLSQEIYWARVPFLDLIQEGNIIPPRRAI